MQKREQLLAGIWGRAIGRVLILLVLVVAVPAFARDWRIADMHDSIAIGKDGTTSVEEKVTFVFVGEYHWISRRIPTQYPGARGSNYTLFLKNLQVTDENGNKLRYDSKRSTEYLTLKIYLDGAIDTTKTVNISYQTPNAIRYFDDHDEFYWNVTGNDSPVPIDHASALVVLPGGSGEGLRAQAFTGVYGSRDTEATSKIEGSTASFETTDPLPMRGGLTIDIFIPKGVIQEPSTLTKIAWFLRSNSIIFLPVFAFIVMFTLWWYKGKDPKAGLSVAPMYEPPKDMTPAEVGTLVDDSIDPRDITSTVVDLAVRGYLKIEETEEKHLIFSNKDYIFHLLKGREQWGDLASHERVTLEHMFEEGGDTCRMSSLKNRFYTAIPIIKQDVIAELKNKGMYTLDPDSAKGYVVGAAIVIAIPFIALQALHVVDFALSAWMLGVAIVLSVVIILLFGWHMTAKSLLGQRTKIHVLGFQEFMNRVDADRLKRMPPDTFEKYLPYAMALGVEHRWAQAFKDIVRDPPSWYYSPTGYGPYGWSPIFFANSMHGMSSDMHSVMVSAPRSSATGSGFGGGGGGGFSGGGFGGGGFDAG